MKRKLLFSALVAIVMTILLPTKVVAQEMYAEFDTNESTLTFKYDNSKPEETETVKVYSFPTSANKSPDWLKSNANIKKVVFDESFKSANPTSCYYWFKGCKYLTEIENLDYLNTSEVTNMESMFSECSGLISLDLSNFTTSSVKSMSRMFVSCSGLTSLDLSSFDTSNVTNMSYMFYDCSGLTSLDLSSFDTSKVTSMHQMFYDCSGLTSLDLSSFDTSNVTTMYEMFKNCTGLITIFASDKFTTGAVTSSDKMFYGCTSLVGAISYDKNIIDATYANCTGYFTNVVPSGDGTAVSPYLIKNAKHLAWFRDKVNGGALSACACLEADIDMSSVCYAADADNGVEELSWIPIGRNTQNWYGTFDGNNKTISNLYINSSELHQGLFGDVCDDNNRASIKDIIFEDVNIKRSNECLGVLVGYAYNADISGIVVNSGSVNGHKNVGGIAGFTSNVELSDCINRIDVTGDDNYVGGIVGFAEGTSAIKNCANYGNVEGMSAGGIVGQTFGVDGNITLENVLSSGDVTYTDNSNEAGLVVGQTSHGLTISGYVVYNSDAKIYYNNTVQDSKAIGVKNDNANVTGEDNIKGLTHEVLKTGEGTWMLNGLSSTGVWGQQLGTDNYPVLGDYKVIKAAKGDNNTYWATFSNQNSDATLSVPSPRDLYVYNATVSGGRLTLSERNDCQVAKGEGVLLKTDGEYVNAKANATDGLHKVEYANNNLVATPATEKTINAEAGYTLYRLTYNNSTENTGLGFYLGLVKDANGNVTSDNGSELKATPGKAYLKVSTGAATTSANAALARGFAFPGDDDTTGIGEIVIEGDAGISGSAKGNDRIYNLQGQQVTTPTKGLYIRNNKKVIIK